MACEQMCAWRVVLLRRCVLGLCVSVALGVTMPAFAEAPTTPESRVTERRTTTAEARRLFAEGLAHVDAEEWDLASEKFRAALALKWAPPVAYNLAAALARSGLMVDALALLDKIEASPRGVSVRLRRDARSLRRQLAMRVANLEVRLEGNAMGVQLLVDDEVHAFAEPRVLDPGRHRLAVVRDGHVVVSRELYLAEGGRDRVVLSLPPDDGQALTTPPPSATLRGDTGQPIYEKWWFWAGLGTVLAGGAAAAIMAGSASSAQPVEGTLTPGILRGSVEP